MKKSGRSSILQAPAEKQPGTEDEKAGKSEMKLGGFIRRRCPDIAQGSRSSSG